VPTGGPHTLAPKQTSLFFTKVTPLSKWGRDPATNLKLRLKNDGFLLVFEDDFT
jgi:hypothetical protein